MDMGFEINKAQVRELDMVFKTLPKTLQSNAMRSAYRDASKPLKTAIKSKIPSFDIKRPAGTKLVNSTILKKSIGTIVRRGKNDRKLYAVVGPLINKGGWFGHWLEFGTLARRSEPLKKKRSAKAQAMADKGLGLKKVPFMRLATNQTRTTVQKVLRFEMIEAIENQMSKTIKRGKI